MTELELAQARVAELEAKWPQAVAWLHRAQQLEPWIERAKIAEGKLRLAGIQYDPKARHTIFGYPLDAEEPAFELLVPPEADALVLLLARVPLEDPNGALSYPLSERVVRVLEILFEVPFDQGEPLEYFLESTVRS